MYSQFSLKTDQNWTLEELSHERAIILTPSIVYLCFLMIVGVIGNLLVVTTYYLRFNRSTFRCFVLVLASYDFFACAIGVPFTIAESFHAYTYKEEVSCRVFRFVLYYTCICSSLTLVLIAFERFRKICRHRKPQMSVVIAKRLLVVVNAGISFISASPALVLFGRSTIHTGISNITGTKCFISDAYVNTIWPTVFNIYLLCLAFASTACMTVCYVFVVRQVAKGGAENINKRLTTQQNVSTIVNISKYLATGDSEFPSSGSSQADIEVDEKDSVDSDNTDRVSTTISCATEGDQSNDCVQESSKTVKTIGTLSQESATQSEEQHTASLLQLPGKIIRRISRKTRENSDTDQRAIGILRNGTENSVPFRKTSIASQSSEINSSRNPSIATLESTETYKNKRTKRKRRFSTPFQLTNKIFKRISGASDKTIRITRLLVVVTVTFVLSYLPHLSLMLWDVFTDEDKAFPKDNLYQIIFYSFFLNNVINPFIYASMDLKFRNECKKLFLCKK